MARIEGRKKLKKFVDISLSFEPNPVTGDLTVLKNERGNQQCHQEYRHDGTWRDGFQRKNTVPGFQITCLTCSMPVLPVC